MNTSAVPWSDYGRPPAITSGPNGEFVVFWLRAIQDGPAPVLGRRFTSAAQPIGGEFHVSTGTGTYYLNPTGAATDSNGDVFVVWQRPLGEFGEQSVGRVFSASGEPYATEFPLTNVSGEEDYAQDVAATIDGNFVAAWVTTNSSRIFARRFTSSGLPIGDPFEVNGNDEANRRELAISSLSGGGFVAVWTVISSPIGVLARVFDADGNPAGDPFAIANNFPDGTGIGFAAVAGSGSDDFTALWTETMGGGTLLGRRMSRSGTPLTNAFPIALSADPAIAIRDSISTIIWGGEGRRFSSDGSPLEAGFTITTNMDGDSVLAAAPNGDFMVAWPISGGVNARKFTICGNGEVDGVEQCDDGNQSGEDGCSPACTIESGWSCTGEPSMCTSGCGDGVVNGSEQCDDGNLTAGDGCSEVCTIEPGWACSGEPSDCAPFTPTPTATPSSPLKKAGSCYIALAEGEEADGTGKAREQAALAVGDEQ